MPDNTHNAAIAQLRALVAKDDELDISQIVLDLLRELTDQRSRSLASIFASAAGADKNLRSQIVRWLEWQQILEIADETVCMTPKGNRSLAIASDSDALLSRFLGNRAFRLERETADRAMLLVLRAMFELQQDEGKAPGA